MGVTTFVIRFVLAAVFAASAFTKLRDRAGVRQAVQDFGLPAAVVGVAGATLPFVEVAIAGLLVVPVTAVVGGLAATGLLVLFTALVVGNLRAGNRPNCHCFGELSAEPISGSTVVRNLALIAGAAVVATAGPGSWPRQLSGADTAIIVGFGLCLLAIAGLTWFAFRLLRQHGSLLLRVDALESGADAGHGHASADEAPRTAGLPVGTQAPEFALVGMHGETMTLSALRATDRPVLLLFSDSGCGPCSALLPEIARWQSELRDELRVVVLAAGAAEENRAKASEHGLIDVLVQEDRAVAHAYRYAGTPGAVLVDVRGHIASPVASGAPAIRDLVRGATHRVPVTAPSSGSAHRRGGLPVGSPVPDVELLGRDGAPIDVAGRRRVLLFWDPACGFCDRILSDVLRWEAERTTTDPELIIVGKGDPDALDRSGFTSPIAFDPDRVVMGSFGADGTPMAVRIDADDRIASDLAVGGPAVRALLESREVQT